MNGKYLVLVVNPGSTTTKIALYKGIDEIRSLEITHPVEELKRFQSNLEQLEFRQTAVEKALTDWLGRDEKLNAVIGRGGPLKPMESGVYRVGEALLSDLASGKLVDHASILGGLIAYEIAKKSGLPSFIADPVSVDEFDEVARISGIPELPRVSLSHALNIKAVVKEYSMDIGVPAAQLNLVVAHLGGGISIAAHRKGRLVDVNNANDAGPFSPERAGTLPLTGVVKLCYSGKFTAAEMKKHLIGNGGLMAHLKTSDAREVAKRIEQGDSNARVILEAMAYQIAKEIGAMATVMHGQVDAIILTGGLAYNDLVVEWVKARVSFIAPVVLKPGQNEMKALAAHAASALERPEIAKDY